jgi:UDP-N-acetylglucosamine 2-epimerase (non-hydrolysing)
MTVYGTRPEAIKMAPLVAALDADERVEPIVAVTGQHREMLDQVNTLFGIRPAHDLDLMAPGASLAEITARTVLATSELLRATRPDVVVVQGDTTTVLATGLAAFYEHIPVVHLEAGLRTGDVRSPFPEEANRRLTAPLADLHLAPTATSKANLVRESTDPARVPVTGNTVIDALRMELARQQRPDVAARVHERLSAAIAPDWKDVPFVLITGHRRENFGGGFDEICAAIATLARRFPDHRFVYPVHLNPNVQRPVREKLGGLDNVRLIAPQEYREFVALMSKSRLILTDSGGVQEEAPSLGKPVLVMRDTTERPEGVDAGTLLLVGAVADTIVSNATRLLTDDAAYQKMAEAKNPYGDGRAAARIVQRFRRHFAS